MSNFKHLFLKGWAVFCCAAVYKILFYLPSFRELNQRLWHFLDMKVTMHFTPYQVRNWILILSVLSCMWTSAIWLGMFRIIYMYIFLFRAGLHLPGGHPSLHGFWCIFASNPSWTVWSILVSWTWKRYSVIKIQKNVKLCTGIKIYKIKNNIYFLHYSATFCPSGSSAILAGEEPQVVRTDRCAQRNY